MVSLLGGLVALAVCAGAEWIHSCRLRRVAHLAFGAQARPRRWVGAVPPLRVAAAGAVAWGLLTLWGLDTSSSEPQSAARDERTLHHLVVALDVSPSMQLADAGPQGDQSRADRARDAVRSVLARLDERRTRVSIVAFYSTARPVVIDTFDPEVTANVLADLPLEHAFAAGKTNLYAGVTAAGELAKGWREEDGARLRSTKPVTAAGELAKPWRERSATLMLVSDGDTLPPQQIPTLPEAYANVLVLGVGSSERGLFIDGHSSRQDAPSLERLALQLRGRYHNANARHVSSDAVGALLASLPSQTENRFDMRRAAVVAVAAGSLLLAFIPVALALAGAGHRPWKLQRRLSLGSGISHQNSLGPLAPAVSWNLSLWKQEADPCVWL